MAQRIKHLLAGDAECSHDVTGLRSVVGTCSDLEQLTPQVLSLLGASLDIVRPVCGKIGDPEGTKNRVQVSETSATRMESGELTPTRCSPPASRNGKRDTRRHVRVTVRLQSHFSSKGEGWPVKESCETSPLGAVASRVWWSFPWE